MVALEDQSLAGVGNVLAVLDAGHTDLTNRFPSGRAAQRMRKAVIDAIIMSVGEEKASKSRDGKIRSEKNAGAGGARLRGEQSTSTIVGKSFLGTAHTAASWTQENRTRGCSAIRSAIWLINSA